MKEHELHDACTRAVKALQESLRRSKVPASHAIHAMGLDLRNSLYTHLCTDVLSKPRDIAPGVPGPRPVLDAEVYHTVTPPFPWTFNCDMCERFSPLFDLVCKSNHDIAHKLKAACVLDDTCHTDTESGCLYVGFRTQADGRAFLRRLRTYLRVRRLAIKALAGI
jgi:hypothetical protein